MRLLPWLRLAVAVVLLAGTGWLGLTEGWIATRTGVTTGQHVATGTQLAYGALGVLGVVALLARHRAATALALAWGATLTATAALAPVVWGGAGVRPALAAGAAAALVAAFVAWAARRHVAARARR